VPCLAPPDKFGRACWLFIADLRKYRLSAKPVWPTTFTPLGTEPGLRPLLRYHGLLDEF